jgi:oxygen-independent coproporphyrinogen-3 oxidase
LTRNGARFGTEAIRAPEVWLTAVEGSGSGLGSELPVSSHEQAIEMALMGLRLTEGIDPRRYEALAGAPLPATGVAELVELGLLERGARLRVTQAGRSVLDGVLRRLLV